VGFAVFGHICGVAAGFSVLGVASHRVFATASGSVLGECGVAAALVAFSGAHFRAVTFAAIHGGLGIFVFLVFIAACHCGFCVFTLTLAAGHRFAIFSGAAIGVMVFGAGGIFVRLGRIAGTATTGFRCLRGSGGRSLGRGLRRSGLRWSGWLLGERREPSGTGGSQEYSYDSDFHFLSPQILN
jgi:hypothetical protein